MADNWIYVPTTILNKHHSPFAHLATRPKLEVVFINKCEGYILTSTHKMLEPVERFWLLNLATILLEHMKNTNEKRLEPSFITLFKSITMLCGTDDIQWNISHVQNECDNIMQKTVNPT